MNLEQARSLLGKYVEITADCSNLIPYTPLKGEYPYDGKVRMIQIFGDTEYLVFQNEIRYPLGNIKKWRVLEGREWRS